jgi:hypothetical protein
VLYSGSMELRLEKEIPAEQRTDDAAALAEFGEWVGEIMGELWAESFKAGGLVIRSMEITKGPSRYDDEAHKNICAAFVTIQWGLSG